MSAARLGFTSRPRSSVELVPLVSKDLRSITHAPFLFFSPQKKPPEGILNYVVCRDREETLKSARGLCYLACWKASACKGRAEVLQATIDCYIRQVQLTKSRPVSDKNGAPLRMDITLKSPALPPIDPDLDRTHGHHSVPGRSVTRMYQ